jgi:DNA-binding transcriptional MerR regulator
VKYTVGEVARIAKTSVRTLHHYDSLGLIQPSERTEAGYRIYVDSDLERLQQVLLFRELGLSLEGIGQIVNDPRFDPLEALVSQRELVAEKARRTEQLLALLDKTILAMERGIPMSTEEMFEVFGDFDPAEYQDEVRERWGDTDAYKESMRRTRRYTKTDWARFKVESEAINAAVTACMDAGLPATDARAMDAVERARQQIDEWFYPCSHEVHSRLADMYVADPRFTATYESIHVGMARYVHDAIKANAARNQ